MNETQYRRKLVEKIQTTLPDCVILRPDPRDIQGIPDLLVLYRYSWAMLEVKISPTAGVQPNQRHYVNLLDGMSFAAIVNPANEAETLSDMYKYFGQLDNGRIY